MKRNSRKVISSVVIATLGLWLGLVSVAPTANAFPVQGGESWSDTFDSTQGIKDFSQTKVVGETMEIGEPDPVDLGVPVPGESAVYAVLGTSLGESGNNVYCGTGEKGHLVEYSPDEVYQEGYCGPTHWGVSNSRGQSFPMPIAAGAGEQRMMSLETDGDDVYGGTGGTNAGHLVRFDPYDHVADPSPVQRPIEDLGEVPGGGEVLSLTFNGTNVFGGTSDGNLFYYDDSAVPPIVDCGSCPGTSGSINCLTVLGSTVYGGTESGHLFSYNGAFNPIGTCPGTSGAIKSLSNDGSTVYGGTADGDVFSHNGGFTDLGNPSGTSNVNALAFSGTDLFTGLGDGHVYMHAIGDPPDTFIDQGVPANSGGAPIKALSLGADGKVYGGTGDDGSGRGHLFRQSGFEDHGDPADPDPASPVTGVTQQANVIYLSNQNGDLYSYSGPDTFNDLGQPDGTTINDIDATVGSVYLVTGGGSLHSYDDETGLVDLGKPDPGDIASITAVLAHGSTVYVGLSDGRLYSHDGADWSELLDTVPGGFTINDLAWKDAPYVGASDGHLYSYNGSLTDHGAADGTAVNALSVFGTDVYLGLQGGDIYSWDGISFSNRGPCGSAVRSLAPGNQCVLAGAEDGHLWVYDGSLRDAGTVPGLTAVRSLCRIGEHVFGGTGGGELFSHEDAYLADNGQPVKEQVIVHCITYDSRGAGDEDDRIYAGAYRNAHFLVIDPDPTNPTVQDRGRPVNGERVIEDIIVASDGEVYGCTYGGTRDLYNPVGGRLFHYDVATGTFTDRGLPPPPDDNWWITSIVEGPPREPNRLIYGATSSSSTNDKQGHFFSWDPVTDTKVNLGVPVHDEGTLSLVLNSNDDKIYGGTQKLPDGDNAHLYRYEGGTSYTEFGEPPVPDDKRGNMNIFALCYNSANNQVFGGQENGYVFAFDADSGEYLFAEQPVPNTEAVNTVITALDDTIWCGTNELPGGNGHLVNYDPQLGAFRDVFELGEGHVRCVAQAPNGSLYGGTRADGGAPAHLFKMDPYRTGDGPYGLSSEIIPGLSDIGGPVSGQDAVGALCAPPGDIKVLYGGTSNDDDTEAHLFMYNHIEGTVVDFGVALQHHDRVTALCAGADGHIYGGTANNDDREGRLFRFYPVLDPGQLNVEDLGVPLADACGVFSLAAAGNGRVIIGTGDKGTGPAWDGCHLIEYDPSGGDFDDKGVCEGTQGRLSALVTGTDGLIYGGTGVSSGQTSSAHFIKFDPSTGVLENKGVQFGVERSVHSVAQGPYGKVYCGTGPEGGLVSYDINSGSFNTEAGWPYAGEMPVLSLAATESAVFGCAGNVGHLFRFTIPGSVFTDMGPTAFGNAGVPAATTDNLGKPCFGTAGDPDGEPAVEATLVRYDPDSRFECRKAVDRPAGAGT